MAYKVGACPQCSAKIMVRDIRGKWHTKEGVYKQVYLNFDNAPSVKVPICSNCVQNPISDKLLSEIVHDNSEACKKETRDRIKSFGKPKSVTIFSNKIVQQI